MPLLSLYLNSWCLHRSNCYCFFFLLTWLCWLDWVGLHEYLIVALTWDTASECLTVVNNADLRKLIKILCFLFYCPLKAVPVKVARKLLLCWPTLQWPLIKVFSNDGPRRHLARFFHLKQRNSNLSNLQNFPLTWDASAHLNISESTFSDIGGLISAFRDIPLSYQLKQSHCAAEMAFISFGSCCAFIGARVVNLRENTFMIADPRTNW